MQITGSFVVTDVFLGQNGNQYLTMVDLETGGTVKFSVDGQMEVAAGQMVKAAGLVVKGQIFKNGGTTNVIVAGSFERAK